MDAAAKIAKQTSSRLPLAGILKNVTKAGRRPDCKSTSGGFRLAL